MLIKWLQYYLSASNGKGHGIHSPFVFDFVTGVLNDRTTHPAFGAIEQLRSKLLADQTVIDIDDFGAGPSGGARQQRTVSDIAKRSAKSPKWGRFLFNMAHYYSPNNILELGTSLGLSSCYLSCGNPGAKLVTLEGANTIAALAKKNFECLALKNIETCVGNFDNTLADAVVSMQSNTGAGPDLVFVDGNHRIEPTLRYFEILLPAMTDHSVIVFDDIYWSREMEQAWKKICEDERVLLSIDLFFVGLVFFRTEFKVKQHFRIRHGL